LAFQFGRALLLLQRQREFRFAHLQGLRESLQTALEFRRGIGALLREHGLLLVEFPGTLALRVVEGLLLRSEPRDVFIELLALLCEFVALRYQRGQRRFGFGERPGRLLCARRQELPQLALHGGDQRILTGRLAAARQLRQRITQILRRMPRRIAHLLGAALLHPQKPRHARVLGLQRPACGAREAEQRRELVLGFIFAEDGLADAQFAALACDELLRQSALSTVQLEAHLDRRLPACLAPRQQILQMRGLVAFEKDSAHRFGDGALARLVRSGEQIEPGLQIVDDEPPAELLEFLNRNALQLHADLASRGNSR
jgi:hypothetical protein